MRHTPNQCVEANRRHASPIGACRWGPDDNPLPNSPWPLTAQFGYGSNQLPHQFLVYRDAIRPESDG